VEPEKQPLLANGSEITFVSRQHILNKQEYTTAAKEGLGKHVLAATDIYVVRAEMLELGQYVRWA
jgi:hypothetical protein